MRRCARCREKVFQGFTVDESVLFYEPFDGCICDDCFNAFMDEKYGVGNWKSTDYDEEEEAYEDDGHGGFYLYQYSGDWFGTGIYWTEWYDDDDDDEDDDIDFENAE